MGIDAVSPPSANTVVPFTKLPAIKPTVITRHTDGAREAHTHTTIREQERDHGGDLGRVPGASERARRTHGASFRPGGVDDELRSKK